MKETSELIPVPPADEEVRALVSSKHNFSQRQLVQMSGPELIRLRRQWYDEARALNLILILKLICQQAGRLNSSIGLTEWRYAADDLTIEAFWNAAGNSIIVRVNGHLVCADNEPGNELCIPGHWILVVLEFFDQMETLRVRAAEAKADREKQELVAQLGVAV